MNMQEKLTERFFRYAAITSQSKAGAGICPSTPGQRELAEVLKADLEALGLVDLEISEFSVLTGRLPSNLPSGHRPVPTVGWVAHLDTVDVKASPHVRPQVIKNYQGGDVVLNQEKQLYIKADQHPELKKYLGEDLIVSDGTSVLGADNKAAIANIMVALETIISENRPHGELYFAFVPDEEVGLIGAKHMDFSKFPVDFAYTIDCCELGEVVYQTFNAASAFIDITGVTAHPMSSKNTLVNPALVAVDLVNCLDRMETPEHTEGTEGFIWVEGLTANAASARVSLKIRDHNKAKYEARKRFIQDAVAYVQAKNPKAGIKLEIVDVYGNIQDAISEENKQCVDYIFQAMAELGIEPKDIAMRGGTDGSYISTKGIPTPNYFTGAHNFHSNCEFMPMGAVEKSCLMTLKLIELIAE